MPRSELSRIRHKTDQGGHYTIPEFQNQAKKLNLKLSMSRRGNCWDNAPQESIYGHMKQEINIAIDIESIGSFSELER